MIGRITQRRSKAQEVIEPKSFDDYEVRLGDAMRGERATMGKSLLDVQRELRIKASYISAIENSDPSVFDTPGFIAGYVRSYARYLSMDPEQVFEDFCRESGFEVAHGMSAKASSKRTGPAPIASGMGGLGSDAFTAPNTPFAPRNGGLLSQIEARAIGSSLVLLALIGGIGFGGWTVLKQVQQVQMAPMEQTPVVLAELDPLQVAGMGTATENDGSASDALDRLYRPQALAVPVMTARDAPISTLDPATFGSFAAPELPRQEIFADSRSAVTGQQPQTQLVPQVVEHSAPTMEMVAVRNSWVRVSSADGSVIFEGIMTPGQRYEIPTTEEAPVLRTGESSAIYFALGGAHFGPVGNRGEVTRNLPLSIDSVTERFDVANIDQDRDLAKMVAELEAGLFSE
ncbi:helix-turn-helix domain-containing protein [Parasedimentitalea huanghaiensis]|uniref:DUF4115 domain-containing protein n=1 Tax=Parasedimentitalea huanghaiensis TaxID=2682100 RepID=A0A6L6WNR2_9RHOB|nr:helix-turn-helix domain-containing protein [Zongyanglinia huanghaiensis]MVO18305.1 DUF4115 domain-containing protein [Zongyanglinia huanghaiensis]